MISLDIRSKIFEHLENGSESTGIEIARELSLAFPDYVHRGLAYRSRMNPSRELSPIDLQGKSFSETMEANKNFLSESGFGDNDKDHGQLIKANIIGFNLSKFLEEKIDLFPVLDQEDFLSYNQESEIILMELISIEEIIELGGVSEK